jgi:hypothetical protein
VSEDKVAEARIWAPWIGIGLVGIGVGGALAAASGTMGPAAIPVWVMVLVGVMVLSRSPIAKALAHRISDPPDALADGEVADAVYGELDELRVRVGELEDRQDFSERLLAEKTAAKDDR